MSFLRLAICSFGTVSFLFTRVCIIPCHRPLQALTHCHDCSGYYADSILKFRLTFPENYPESPPAVDFVTDVFHPLISQAGGFNLAARFRPWR